MSEQLKNVSASTNLDELWPVYKQQFEKSYSAEEDKQRFEIFKKNVKRIVEHNEKYARGESSYTLGINHFADLESQEVPTGLAVV